VSFDVPVYTADVVGLGIVRLLEALRALGLAPRFYQASSSELFGRVRETPQRETTPFHPRSPYACAKAFAFHVARNYREAYGMHVSNGILFNHESERRGEAFVTRKITRAVGRIACGLQQSVSLGNLDARRDWGFAGDYADAMWRMLQQPEGDDYVVATGVSHSVRELCERAFGRAGLDWERHVVVDPQLRRPAEVDEVVGDATKARSVLGWAPTVTFDALVERMVAADVARARAELAAGSAPGASLAPTPRER
jgi:GDPmannose 4,6-dehydratase